VGLSLVAFSSVASSLVAVSSISSHFQQGSTEIAFVSVAATLYQDHDVDASRIADILSTFTLVFPYLL
jgi:hypothetical protein